MNDDVLYPTHACLAHVGEGDFFKPIGGGHAPMIAPIVSEWKPLPLGPGVCTNGRF